MSDWTDLLHDPRPVRAIFGDRCPSLQGIELHELIAHRDGPSVVLRFDIREFPADPPRKWIDAGFNRVQLRLEAWDVQELDVRGMTTNPTLDLTLAREGSLIRLHATGEGVQIDLAAHFVAVASDSVSAYQDTDL